jgi:hypothetical protein
MNKEDLGKFIASSIDKYSPCYFISIQYNIYDDNRKVIKDRVKKLYDAYAVFDTHKHINNLLWDAFDKNLMMWWFMERNPDFTEDGKIIRGYYHSHLILSTIQDRFFEEPSRTLKKIYHHSSSSSKPDSFFTIPIINQVFMDEEERHYALIEGVLRQAEWVRGGKHKGENKCIDIRPITNIHRLFYKPNDADGGYLLKQLNTKQDLDKLIDFKNSSF